MIARKELTLLTVTAIMAKMVLVFPKLLLSNSGSAAWIQVIYNVLCAAAVFAVISWLYVSDKNVIEMAGEIGGKWLRIPTGLVVFAVFMINFALIIRVFPETVKTVLLQNFDTNLITVLFMGAIGVGAALGIESLARVNYIFIPIIGVILALLIVLLVPHYNIYNLLPILGTGAKKIFADGFHTISIYSDMLLLNVLLPYYKDEREAKKSIRAVFLITAPVTVLIILAYCLVYPYPVSGEFMIPFYQLARILHLGDFLGRFEPVFQFAWSILLLLYSALYVFALCRVWQMTFDLDFYRPLVFPVVIISGAISLLPATLGDIVTNAEFENKLAYPAAFLLPVIFGAISKIREKKRKEKSR